jgi:hypothetical protein
MVADLVKLPEEAFQKKSLASMPEITPRLVRILKR